MKSLAGEAYPSSVLVAADSHKRAMTLDIRSAVENLADLLGATDVAAIGGVQETRAVQQWIDGTRAPQRPHVLRFALQLCLMISTVATRELVRAWFHGSNPGLNDATPLTLLRDRPLEEAQGPLMAAARSFAARDASA
ncbi:MAG TPA: hypothetical protein VEW74_07660 [Candidatus Nitrosotalea sp.]|nr:hypothetical protein [Candidatus Nitrosotalea sp.]